MNGCSVCIIPWVVLNPCNDKIMCSLSLGTSYSGCCMPTALHQEGSIGAFQMPDASYNNTCQLPPPHSSGCFHYRCSPGPYNGQRAGCEPSCHEWCKWMAAQIMFFVWCSDLRCQLLFDEQAIRKRCGFIKGNTAGWPHRSLCLGRWHIQHVRIPSKRSGESWGPASTAILPLGIVQSAWYMDQQRSGFRFLPVSDLCHSNCSDLSHVLIIPEPDLLKTRPAIWAENLPFKECFSGGHTLKATSVFSQYSWLPVDLEAWSGPTATSLTFSHCHCLHRVLVWSPWWLYQRLHCTQGINAPTNPCWMYSRQTKWLGEDKACGQQPMEMETHTLGNKAIC